MHFLSMKCPDLTPEDCRQFASRWTHPSVHHCLLEQIASFSRHCAELLNLDNDNEMDVGRLVSTQIVSGESEAPKELLAGEFIPHFMVKLTYRYQ